MDVIAGKESGELLEYLLKRRSVVADDLVAPGPSSEELEQILTVASRVPDHGKIVPFYYLVFEGDARDKAGAIIEAAYKKQNPDASEEQLARERNRLTRVPLVVAIIHRARMSKNPQMEQFLTCGAVGQNFLLACNALGYGAQWLTEWYAYDEDVRKGLGLDEQDVVAGFMVVGSVDEAPKERDRPDLSAIVNHWEEGADLKKGDQYHREKFGYPEIGLPTKA